MSPYPRWERAPAGQRMWTLWKANGINLAHIGAQVDGAFLATLLWPNHVECRLPSLDDALSWCVERSGVEMGA